MEEAIFDEVEGTFIGIDLGTSNSVVSFFRNGEFEQVKFKGKNIMPSVLFWESKDKVIFGERALKKGSVDANYLLKEFKRDLGTNNKYTFGFSHSQTSDDQKQRIYVIDTNIFLEDPEVLKLFDDRALIKIPIKVIDELTFRKTQPETETAAVYALENIEQLKAQSNVELVESHKDVLVDDIDANDKNSLNDNKILSVAKHLVIEEKDATTVLLTNDKGLKLKADVEGVTTQTLEQFNRYLGDREKESSYDELILSPKDATRMLLAHLRQESEKYIRESVQKAVVTVPVNFSPTQIGQVKEAAEQAGFDDVKIQKEPVAAGFAYALEEQENKLILVYDFGGGTFDASILQINNGTIKVLGFDGNSRLGGADVTRKLCEIIYDELLDRHDLDMFDKHDSGLSLKDFNKNNQVIWLVAEQAKIDLSDFEQVDIDIPNLLLADGSMINLQFQLGRKRFEDEISDIRKETLDVIKNLIQKTQVAKEELSEIVMAGGSSLIPSIRDSLEDTLGIAPKRTIDSSIVISRGAVLEAMRCWSKAESVQKQIIYHDNALRDFGIGLKGHNFDLLIAAGAELPISECRQYTTEKDEQQTINIEVFQRKTTHADAVKTFDKGIDFIDSIKINGLPQSKVGELDIHVTFELTKDDALAIDVQVFDQQKQVCGQDTLTVTRASDA